MKDWLRTNGDIILGIDRKALYEHAVEAIEDEFVRVSNYLRDLFGHDTFITIIISRNHQTKVFDSDLTFYSDAPDLSHLKQRFNKMLDAYIKDMNQEDDSLH